MEIEKVQCLVRLNDQDGKPSLTTIVKAGPDAVPVTEIPILRMVHDIGDGLIEEECAISMARVVGTYKTTKAQEFERLKAKYGNDLVNSNYPQGRMMPTSLSDCELPPGCVIAPPKKSSKSVKAPVQEEPELSPEDEAKLVLSDMLIAAGVEIKGDPSVEELEALAVEHGLMEAA